MRLEGVMEYSRICLDRRLYNARTAISHETMTRLSDVELTTLIDDQMRHLMLKLEATVYAHKLASETASAPFSAEVSIEQEAARYVWLCGVITLLTSAVGLIAGSALLLAASMLLALVSVVIYAANPGKTHRRTVSGTVTIPIETSVEFPEVAKFYPKNMGRQVIVQSLGEPSYALD